MQHLNLHLHSHNAHQGIQASNLPELPHDAVNTHMNNRNRYKQQCLNRLLYPERGMQHSPK